MKITYHSIRPYGTNTKLVEPKPSLITHVVVCYDDTGLVICTKEMPNLVLPNMVKEMEQIVLINAKELAEHVNAASYAILS